MAAISSMVLSFFSDDSVDETSPLAFTELIVSLVTSSFLADEAVSLLSSLAIASSVESLGMLPSGERMSLRDLLRKTMLRQFLDIPILFFLELVEML